MNLVNNLIILRGNLGRDPEVKETANGKKLAKFSVATSRSYKNAQGEYENDTTWHNAIAWGKVAERVDKALKKGYQVFIEGKQINRSYEDSKGVKRYVSEVLIGDFDVLKRPQQNVKADQADGDGLPF